MKRLHPVPFIFLLLTLGTPHWALGYGGLMKLDLRTRAIGAFHSTSWTLEEGKKSNFSGYGYGFQLEALSKFAPYAIGFSLGFITSDEKNSASKNGLSESYTDHTYFLGGKLYAAAAFVGAYLTYSEVDVYSKLDAERRAKYTGFGIKGDIGLDFYISGKRISFTPGGSYLIRNLKKTGVSESKRVDTLGANLTLNVDF